MTKGEKADDPMLKSTINFWESSLLHHKFLMSPSTQTLVEHTVKYLKELDKMRDTVQDAPVKNPYPENIVDEASGIEVLNEKHRIWDEGYQAGVER